MAGERGAAGPVGTLKGMLFAPVRAVGALLLSYVGVKGFYGHVERNDLRSLVMFAGFAVASQILGAAVLFLPLMFFDGRHSLILDASGYVERYVPLIFLLSAGLFLHKFVRHVTDVRVSTHFDYVERARNPRLVNMVEQQAIAAGLPFPRVAIIESPARNAFACGLSRDDAVVVVTRGLLQALDDEELEAVIAHEIAHIRNGDIRLMAVANILLGNLIAVERRGTLRIRGWKYIVLCFVFPAFLLIFMMSGFVARMAVTLGRATRLVVSSSREFIADAEAIRMTHNPAALISALRRIEGQSAVEGVDPALDAMMIDGAVLGPFATHPPIEERIEIIKRLAGDMALTRGIRRDTRPEGQRAPPPDRFGRRRTPRDAELVAAGVFARVKQGSDAQDGGMSPAMGYIMLAAIGIFVVFQFVSFRAVESALAPLRRATDVVDATFDRHVAPQIGAARSAASPQPVGASGAADRDATAVEAIPADCFTTDTYSVGDRGLRKLGRIDYQLVQAYSLDQVSGASSKVEIEKYLGMRARSVRAVNNARDAGLDKALLDYVDTRKATLMVAHRFFGDEGLKVMQKAHAGGYDREILARLKQRLAAGAPALVADPGTMAELELLVSDPAGFVPCAARAGAGGRSAGLRGSRG